MDQRSKTLSVGIIMGQRRREKLFDDAGIVRSGELFIIEEELSKCQQCAGEDGAILLEEREDVVAEHVAALLDELGLDWNRERLEEVDVDGEAFLQLRGQVDELAERRVAREMAGGGGCQRSQQRGDACMAGVFRADKVLEGGDAVVQLEQVAGAAAAELVGPPAALDHGGGHRGVQRDASSAVVEELVGKRHPLGKVDVLEV